MEATAASRVTTDGSDDAQPSHDAQPSRDTGPSPVADMPTLSGWGGQKRPGRQVCSEDLERATTDASLCRGLGRSYGDSSLPARPEHKVVGTPLADRILAFDRHTGRMRAEAGFSLDELNRLFLRRGWFTPVTPGTKFVTLGGMVASDVHGKNHHCAGCFGEHVRALKMRLADGRVVECGPEQHTDLFDATLGGMGLTGHILEVDVQLERIPSPWIWTESRRIPDIDEFLHALREAEPRWPFSMGWIDCVSRGRLMGRGHLMVGRWATSDEAPDEPPAEKHKLRFPFTAPDWLINPLTSRIFNGLYYWKHLPQQKTGITHPDSFFYPLDAIHDWNLAYGRRGFTQYQCVIPHEAGPDAPRRFLELLTGRGGASPLCVIKDCGPEGRGMLSFPLPGISIAVDLAITPETQALVDALNEFVIEQGGRIYLTKDGFTRPEHFAAMEPRLAKWQEVRRRWDPDGRLKSAQSVRVLGDAT